MIMNISFTLRSFFVPLCNASSPLPPSAHRTSPSAVSPCHPYRLANISYSLYKWDHAVYVLSASFIQHDYFEIHPCVVGINSSFHFGAEYHSIVWIYNNLFTHTLVDGHLGYFKFFILMNKTVMNIYGKVLLLTYIFHFHMCKHLLVEPLGHKAEACLTAIIHLV